MSYLVETITQFFFKSLFLKTLKTLEMNCIFVELEYRRESENVHRHHLFLISLVSLDSSIRFPLRVFQHIRLPGTRSGWGAHVATVSFFFFFTTFYLRNYASRDFPCPQKKNVAIFFQKCTHTQVFIIFLFPQMPTCNQKSMGGCVELESFLRHSFFSL